MYRLDAAQTTFFEQLGRSPVGLQLKAELRREIEACNRQLRTLSGEELTREQGKAQCLDQFLDRLEARAAAAPRTEPRRFLPSSMDPAALY